MKIVLYNYTKGREFLFFFSALKPCVIHAFKQQLVEHRCLHSSFCELRFLNFYFFWGYVTWKVSKPLGSSRADLSWGGGAHAGHRRIHPHRWTGHEGFPQRLLDDRELGWEQHTFLGPTRMHNPPSLWVYVSSINTRLWDTAGCFMVKAPWSWILTGIFIRSKVKVPPEFRTSPELDH